MYTKYKLILNYKTKYKNLVKYEHKVSAMQKSRNEH